MTEPASGMERRTRRWVIGAVGLGAALVGTGAIFVLQPPDAVLVAGLQPKARDYSIVASFLVGRDTLRFGRTAGAPAPDGRVTQLWAIAPGTHPYFLGTVPEAASWRITLPPDLVAEAEALTIVITDAPAGAARTAPLAPILAAERLVLR
ncbi:MAG: hypothetical protein AAGM84_12800 [Pseudomonadota bacterium]